MSVTLDSVVSLTVWVCGAQCLSLWIVLFHLLSWCVEHNVYHCEQCCFTYCLGVWSTMSIIVNSVVSHTVWVCGAQCHVGQCWFTYCLGVWSTMSIIVNSVVSHTVWVCGAQCLSLWIVLFHLLSECVEHNVCHVGQCWFTYCLGVWGTMSVMLDSVGSLTVWVCGAQCLSL